MEALVKFNPKNPFFLFSVFVIKSLNRASEKMNLEKYR